MPRDRAYIWDAADAFGTGLAPYYPIIYAAVCGLEARAVFEFGIGESTHVILDALSVTGGMLYSCATTPQVQAGAEGAPWHYYQGQSEDALAHIPPEVWFDLVLHDGSHAADVVAADLATIARRICRGGLLLVHDALHSYSGAEVRAGIERGLAGVPHVRITLPWAFGLTIVRIAVPDAPPLSLMRQKVGSPNVTIPAPEGWR